MKWAIWYHDFWWITKLIGKETPEMKEIAINVEDDMNYELTEVMTEYRAEHERMLWSLPATGSAFKKVYYDPNLGRANRYDSRDTGKALRRPSESRRGISGGRRVSIGKAAGA